MPRKSSLPVRSALSAALLLACSASQAATRQHNNPPHATPPPHAAALRLSTLDIQPVPHQQARPLTPAQRPPQSSSKTPLRADYDHPTPTARRLRALATTPCDPQAFAAASGSQLVALIRGADVDSCINTFFSLTGSTAGQVFGEAKMVTVANALLGNDSSYAGNNANGTLQLILFLRAGYYAQYGDPTDVGSYGTALKNAIRPALDGFVANAHFHDVNDSHGAVLAEFVTLIDSAGENAHQLPTLRDLLDRYNASYHPYFYMMTAVNNVFTVLFRGHYNADFQAAVQADGSITTALSGFIGRNAAEAGTNNEYLLANAGREMARFLQYPSLVPTVQPLVKSVLNAYGMTGAGASVWVSTADIADYYDHADCSYYGICNFRTQLAQAVLPVDHQCSTDLHLRAQALTPAQVTQVCNTVMGEEGFFHRKVGDHDTPVADDNNKTLELVIFHSSTDYQTYSGAIFGNDTNNGGIYLEGNPADPANQPRFVAYEAEWLRPDFQVWNLTHEYVHYLDGRYDMYGDFSAETSQPTVWWIEGLAEYMSYSYRGLPYPEAIADAGTGQYPLSTVFANDYNSGQERVYRWGYLGVRYMFENHTDEVNTILGDFRPGNYTAYGSYLASIRTSHDADWTHWLSCLNTHQGDTTSCGGNGSSDGGGTPTPTPGGCTPGDGYALQSGCPINVPDTAQAGNLRYFYLLIPAGTQQLVVSTAGGSGNADLYVSASGWPSPTRYDASSTGAGNTESVVINQPVAGSYYYIAVDAQAPFSGVSLTATASATANPPPPGNCTSGDGYQLQSGCTTSITDTPRAGDLQYFYIRVPAGTRRLDVNTGGGSGNADLYVSASGWPSATRYDAKSTGSTNRESVSINQPASGRDYFIAVAATTPFSGASITATATP